MSGMAAKGKSALGLDVVEEPEETVDAEGVVVKKKTLLSSG